MHNTTTTSFFTIFPFLRSFHDDDHTATENQITCCLPIFAFTLANKRKHASFEIPFASRQFPKRKKSMNLNADDSISWNFIGIVPITHFIPQKLSFCCFFFFLISCLKTLPNPLSNQELRREAFKHSFLDEKRLAQIFFSNSDGWINACR